MESSSYVGLLII